MIVDAACYEHGQRIPGEFDYETAAFRITEPDVFAWVGLHEPSPEEFDQAVKTFHLHELAVDDALRAHQRPKLETFDDTLVVVTKPARYADLVEIIEFGEDPHLRRPGLRGGRPPRRAASSRRGTSSRPIPHVLPAGRARFSTPSSIRW
jgi:Mg2+ and Co2+ transporter CorA